MSVASERYRHHHHHRSTSTREGSCSAEQRSFPSSNHRYIPPPPRSPSPQISYFPYYDYLPPENGSPPLSSERNRTRSRTPPPPPSVPAAHRSSTSNKMDIGFISYQTPSPGRNGGVSTLPLPLTPGSASAEHPRTHTDRVYQACEPCKSRKAKCDGAKPLCDRCQAKACPCNYASERKLRGKTKANKIPDLAYSIPKAQPVRVEPIIFTAPPVRLNPTPKLNDDSNLNPNGVPTFFRPRFKVQDPKYYSVEMPYMHENPTSYQYRHSNAGPEDDEDPRDSDERTTFESERVASIPSRRKKETFANSSSNASPPSFTFISVDPTPRPPSRSPVNEGASSTPPVPGLEQTSTSSTSSLPSPKSPPAHHLPEADADEGTPPPTPSKDVFTPIPVSPVPTTHLVSHSTHYAANPQQYLDRDAFLGMMYDFLSLRQTTQSRERAIIRKAHYDTILAYLKGDDDSSGTGKKDKGRNAKKWEKEGSGWKGWIASNFRLGVVEREEDDGEGEKEEIVCDKNGKKVAVREEMYDLLTYFHAGTRHEGRDKMRASLGKHYCGITKNFLDAFIKECPGCQNRRLTGSLQPKTTGPNGTRAGTRRSSNRQSLPAQITAPPDTNDDEGGKGGNKSSSEVEKDKKRKRKVTEEDVFGDDYGFLGPVSPEDLEELDIDGINRGGEKKKGKDDCESEEETMIEGKEELERSIRRRKMLALALEREKEKERELGRKIKRARKS